MALPPPPAPALAPPRTSCRQRQVLARHEVAAQPHVHQHLHDPGEQREAHGHVLRHAEEVERQDAAGLPGAEKPGRLRHEDERRHDHDRTRATRRAAGRRCRARGIAKRNGSAFAAHSSGRVRDARRRRCDATRARRARRGIPWPAGAARAGRPRPAAGRATASSRRSARGAVALREQEHHEAERPRPPRGRSAARRRSAGSG